jgi:hypothetical protein
MPARAGFIQPSRFCGCDMPAVTKTPRNHVYHWYQFSEVGFRRFVPGRTVSEAHSVFGMFRSRTPEASGWRISCREAEQLGVTGVEIVRVK